MSTEEVFKNAFLDELNKIAASKSRLKIPQTRQGRRSMHVDTLLKKDKDGTLFKKADGVAKPGDVPARDAKDAKAGPGVRVQDGRDLLSVIPSGTANFSTDAWPETKA